jgi:hypothetical protein
MIVEQERNKILIIFDSGDVIEIRIEDLNEIWENKEFILDAIEKNMPKLTMKKEEDMQEIVDDGDDHTNFDWRDK